MHILVHNSSSKDNQTVKFGQLIQHNVKNIFKNRAENKVAELVPYPFFFHVLFICFCFCFFCFFKNLVSSVTGYHGQLSSCTISDKNNDPTLGKLSDGRTDG